MKTELRTGELGDAFWWDEAGPAGDATGVESVSGDVAVDVSRVIGPRSGGKNVPLRRYGLEQISTKHFPEVLPMPRDWRESGWGCGEFAVASQHLFPAFSLLVELKFCSGVKPSPPELKGFSFKDRSKWNKVTSASPASNWSRNGLVMQFEPIRTEEKHFWGTLKFFLTPLKEFPMSFVCLFFSSSLFELGLGGTIIAAASGQN